MLRADLVIQKKPEERGEPSMRVEEDITRILHAREKLNASTESAFMHLCRKWDEMVALQGAVFAVHPPIGGDIFSQETVTIFYPASSC